MIVTIDGPAGAGKSSIARQVADRLGFEFLDTGAMYRAVTLGAIRAQIEFSDVDALVAFAGTADLKWKGCRISLNGVDVTEEIRTPTVTGAIRYLADLPDVRRQLTLQQRRIAAGRSIVTEGRDQGTDVFPDADCKIFLTASPHERALRRHQQLADAGRHMAIEDVIAAQDRRDAEDRCRPVGALRPADDAVTLDTDGMSPDEVLDRTLQIIESAVQRDQVKDCS
ncbi:Cytidylate kinase [Rubripirellula lacrimiformis]|uniref:Cytidylate kinase n=1 Tax=Rubripirellula lacrimiformis TaxID=1930273 RepID=A0A517NAX9_9BACT|nr:(d)CMP kinase [Rubripirellula lacrimiformis]QDT04281.1 Cytidylate kinase [Rubripirellula lacrimiformis]